MDAECTGENMPIGELYRSPTGYTVNIPSGETLDWVRRIDWPVLSLRVLPA